MNESAQLIEHVIQLCFLTEQSLKNVTANIPFKFNISHLTTLSYIDDYVFQSDLEQYLKEFSKSKISKILDTLCQYNFIEKKMFSKDNRRYIIQLTKSGKIIKKNIYLALKQDLASVLAELKPIL
ncbi:MAG: hypothetical protein GY756_14415 [bacterium]|nr:hypothetical protein [bacterium]